MQTNSPSLRQEGCEPGPCPRSRVTRCQQRSLVGLLVFCRSLARPRHWQTGSQVAYQPWAVHDSFMLLLPMQHKSACAKSRELGVIWNDARAKTCCCACFEVVSCRKELRTPRGNKDLQFSIAANQPRRTNLTLDFFAKRQQRSQREAMLLSDNQQNRLY